jgi:beta-lactamase class C
MVPFRQHTSVMPSKKVASTRKPFHTFHSLACCLLLLPALAAAAQPATAPDDFKAEALEMEALADQLVQRARIPGLAMAIVERGEVVSLRGYGVVDSKTRDPVGPDTVFRLASLSKSFAGTLSALLVQEGAMSWDAPIANQLPAFRLRDMQGAQRVNLREILSQRVGLNYNTYDRLLEADEPYQLLAERLSDAPMMCAPGQCYSYQNIAFSLVGDLVFAATGDFYAHQVESRLFHPLGMYNATYGREGLEASASWARPHVRSGGAWISVRPKETYYRVPPAAGVNASIRDMSLWLIAQMGHRPDVLPEAILNEIQTPQVETPGELRSSPWRRERLLSAYYGMGWRIYDYSGNTLIYHAGAVQGYRGMIAFLPDRDIGVVVLWNSESAMPSGLMPTVIDRALNLPARDWLTPAPAPRRRRR